MYIWYTINLYNVDGFENRRTKKEVMNEKKIDLMLGKAIADMEKHSYFLSPTHCGGSGWISSWFYDTRQRLSGGARTTR